jgi:peptidoglycan/xylan/chitin deacetylase (PgdA/CDA1 family)
MRALFLLGLAALCFCASTAGAPSPRPVPILEFHVVGDPPPGAPTPGLYDSVATFRAQLAWLAAHGYHAVTLHDVYESWTHGKALPARPVVLTFDDGYPEDYTTVLPLLRARGWVGNLNLQIGNLVPKRVRELIAAGWEIDAHTFTHPDLTKTSAAQLRREVAGARTWIRNVFEQPVDFFCYPAGRYDAAVVAAVRRAGYLGAETELPGPASPANGLFTLHRIELLRTDGVAGMAAKLG